MWFIWGYGLGTGNGGMVYWGREGGGGAGGAGFIWPTTIRLFVRNVTDTSLCTFCGQKYNTSYLFLQCQISYNFGVN